MQGRAKGAASAPAHKCNASSGGNGDGAAGGGGQRRAAAAARRAGCMYVRNGMQANKCAGSAVGVAAIPVIAIARLRIERKVFDCARRRTTQRVHANPRVIIRCCVFVAAIRHPEKNRR